MENTKTNAKSDNYGAKFAHLFVFVTVIIGTSAVMPTSILQEFGLIQEVERHSAGDEFVVSDIQTGRYLKVPSRF